MVELLFVVIALLVITVVIKTVQMWDLERKVRYAKEFMNSGQQPQNAASGCAVAVLMILVTVIAVLLAGEQAVMALFGG